MQWVTLTAADLKTSMTALEVQSFGTACTDGDPEERITQILADLVAEIRGFIASWSTNTLSADPALIPAEFKSRALAVARWRTLLTIPNYEPNDARKADWEKADAFFVGQVATGKNRPQPADDAIPNTVPKEEPEHGVQVVSGPGLRTGRQRMDGL